MGYARLVGKYRNKDNTQHELDVLITALPSTLGRDGKPSFDIIPSRYFGMMSIPY